MVKTGNFVWTILLLGLVLVAIILAVNTKPSIVIGSDTEKDKISVSGRAELTVDPDEVEIYIEIETTEPTAVETKDENAEISDDVIAALKKAGVKSSDIETYRFYLYPKYEWNRNTSKSELVGYTLRHTLKVTTDDLDKTGDLIDVAIDEGANRVERVEFKLSKEKEKDVNDEAMEKAAGNAREKAEALTDALGVKLGKITTISESSYYYEPFRYSGDVLMEAAAPGGKVSTEIQPQKLEVSATVNVVFEIS